MSTLRFGSSSSRDVPDALVENMKENIDEKESIDPDRLMQCPFDKNHQIRACRFPYHLIKCRINNPQVAKGLKTCPFNARHLVPRHELARHTRTCENRVVVDSSEASNGNAPWHVPVSTWVNPDVSENWESEVDDAAAAYVWGKTNLNQNPETKPPTINLGPHSRAPNTVPWFTMKQ